MSVLQKVLEFFHVHPHATLKQDDPARPNDFTLHETPEAPAQPDVVVPREQVQALRVEGALLQHPHHREAYKPVQNVSKAYYDRHFGATSSAFTAAADEERRRQRQREEDDEEDRRRRRRREEEESSSNVGSSLLAGAVGVGLGMAISSMMDSDSSSSSSSSSDDNSFSGGGGGDFSGGGSSSSDSSSSFDSGSSSFDSGSSSFDSGSGSSGDW